MLPVIFEIDGETTHFELEVLWKKEEVEDDGPSETQVREEESQFVIEDDDDDEDEEPAPKPAPSASKPKQMKTLPSLAERLFSSLTDLLFCCGFTLPVKIQVDHYKINYVIWCVSFIAFWLYANSHKGKRALVLRLTQALTKAWNRIKPKFYDCFSCSSPDKYTLRPRRCLPGHLSTPST